MINLWKETEGQDLTEYALLLVLVGLTAVASIQGFAGVLVNTFLGAASNITNATTTTT